MTHKRNLQHLGMLLLFAMIVMFCLEVQQDLGIYGFGDIFKYSLGLSLSFTLISLEFFRNRSLHRKKLLSFGIIKENFGGVSCEYNL